MLSWCSFYSGLKEMMENEKPDFETICNDKALDDHLLAIIKKREQKKFEDKFDRKE